MEFMLVGVLIDSCDIRTPVQNRGITYQNEFHPHHCICQNNDSQIIVISVNGRSSHGRINKNLTTHGRTCGCLFSPIAYILSYPYPTLVREFLKCYFASRSSNKASIDPRKIPDSV